MQNKTFKIMEIIFSIIGLVLGLFLTIFILFVIVGVLKLFFGSMMFMGGFVLKTIGSFIFWLLVIVVVVALIL